MGKKVRGIVDNGTRRSWYYMSEVEAGGCLLQCVGRSFRYRGIVVYRSVFSQLSSSKSRLQEQQAVSSVVEISAMPNRSGWFRREGGVTRSIGASMQETYPMPLVLARAPRIDKGWHVII